MLVKATRAKCITETVFFKHKFITQMTVTPEDAIIKECQDLKLALQGQSNIEGIVQMDAIKQIDQALEPNYKVPIDHGWNQNSKNLSKPNLQGWRQKHHLQGWSSHLQGWSRRSHRAQ